MAGPFVGRKKELDFLAKALKAKKNAAIISSQFSGKTTLLKQFIQKHKNELITYNNLEFVGVTPEAFAIHHIANVCFSLNLNKDAFAEYHHIEYLQKLKLGNANESINIIANELEKIKPNQKLIVETALKFPEFIAEERKKHVTVIIDEFQELLDLNNFEQIKDIAALFNSLKLKNSSYIFAGIDVLGVSGLLETFDTIEATSLTLDETKELVSKFKKISEEDLEKLHWLSSGNPYVVTAIAQNLGKSVEETFIQELTSGSINHYCSTTYHDLLSRSRGKTLLMHILHVLSLEDGLKLSEVSRKIYRQAPVAKSLLTRLMDVKLVSLEDGKYDIEDKVLKRWLVNETSRGTHG